MLYPKNTEARLSAELFRSPTSEYRGTPFWAWNGKLNRETLYEQIQNFKKMGLGGFHMHVRTGMDSPYLDREFMDYIRFCIDTAKDEKMLAWLYDEDRWPSGTAGGRVTADRPEFVRKTLLLTTEPYAPDRPNRAKLPEARRGQRPMRHDNGELLAVYDVRLNADGTLAGYRSIGENDEAVGTKWYAYMEHSEPDPWFNNQAYIDALNPDAVDAFIESTHEVYARETGEFFGNIVPAIFTDEPQFSPKETLAFALEKKDVILPWTAKMPEYYREAYGEELVEKVPELLWMMPEGESSATPWRYQNLLADLFSANYCGRIGRWCDEHGIALTGHLMGEPSLDKQTQYVGDAMRCYSAFGIPGIDMLCDFHEYNTAKQTQSIVRQKGAEGMLSELYGVTGWDCDFRVYKLQGDWQAALGVTVRVPHLAWMTMKGEAKRDYPASMSHQSPWWEEYSFVEDHFARLNTALTRGKAEVRVAVVHPIESYWIHWGPAERIEAPRAQMEEQFAHLTETLLFGGIDFDFLCEAELPRMCEKPGFPLQVGKMAYDTVLVPPVRTLRSTTIAKLEAFVRAGGRLIFLGGCPDYVDAVPSDAAAGLYESAQQVPFDDAAILDTLEPERFLDVRRSDGRRENTLIYQLRRDGEGLWLFLCNGKNPVSPDVEAEKQLHIRLKGEYALTLYDTLSGEISPLPAKYENGCTVLNRIWYLHDSLLIRLEPGRLEGGAGAESALEDSVSMRFGMVPVKLEEPNMLLLDMAEYALNGGEFHPEEEILRMDNEARRKLGIPVRRKEVLQPYLIEDEIPANTLTLRFTIPAEYAVTGAKLALEEPETAKILFNGAEVPVKTDGWYVDKCIETMPLPEIPVGENVLEITVPIGQRTNLEAFYLLGDFGVRVNGTTKTLTAPVRKLGWGDIVPQGLPFYTGNLYYSFRVRSEGAFSVRVPQYRGGLIKVLVDGKEAGAIVYSPYCLKVDAEPGEHEVTLKLYGTRYNGFAQLHHTQGVYFYQSPNSWRSAGDMWSYEYIFKPAGILKSPEIFGAETLDEKGRVRPLESFEHVIEVS